VAQLADIPLDGVDGIVESSTASLCYLWSDSERRRRGVREGGRSLNDWMKSHTLNSLGVQSIV